MAVSRRLGVRQRLIAQQATSALNLGQVGTLLKTVFVTILTAEAILAILLFPRFLMRGDSVGDSIWYSVFYAISAFNNAGFTIHPGGAEYFSEDPWILSLIMIGVFVGSLGFPVVLMIAMNWNRPKNWDLHTRLTLTTTTIVLALGFVFLLLFESGNPKTLGDKNAGHTLMEVLFMAVMPRSGGFSTMDVADMSQSTHLLMDVMMFIGGGSSSTAGGIKVTTVAVLVLAAYAEARGLTDVNVFGRRLTASTIKLSISILLTGATIVFVGTLVMLQISDESLDRVLFEVISAFGTVGLSAGVSASVSEPGLYTLSVLMLIGRLGTITLAAACRCRTLPVSTATPKKGRSLANENSSILVIGLGRFGSATAVTLTRLGREVMAIEHNAELVKDWSGKLTHVVEADSTNIDALRQVGAADFQTAVVASAPRSSERAHDGEPRRPRGLAGVGEGDLPGPRQDPPPHRRPPRPLPGVRCRHPRRPPRQLPDDGVHRVRRRPLRGREDAPTAGDPGVHPRRGEGPRQVRRDDRRHQEPGPRLHLRRTDHPRRQAGPPHRRGQRRTPQPLRRTPVGGAALSWGNRSV